MRHNSYCNTLTYTTGKCNCDAGKVEALLRVARAAEELYVILERWSRAYPTDVFPEPPAGQHGKTVDACSAAMGRHVTKKLLEDFGDVKEALKEVEHLL